MEVGVQEGLNNQWQCAPDDTWDYLLGTGTTVVYLQYRIYIHHTWHVHAAPPTYTHSRIQTCMYINIIISFHYYCNSCLFLSNVFIEWQINNLNCILKSQTTSCFFLLILGKATTVMPFLITNCSGSVKMTIVAWWLVVEMWLTCVL